MAKAKLQKPAESKVTLQLSIEEAGAIREALKDNNDPLNLTDEAFWALTAVLEEAGVNLDG